MHIFSAFTFHPIQTISTSQITPFLDPKSCHCYAIMQCLLYLYTYCPIIHYKPPKTILLFSLVKFSLVSLPSYLYVCIRPRNLSLFTCSIICLFNLIFHCSLHSGLTLHELPKSIAAWFSLSETITLLCLYAVSNYTSFASSCKCH